MRRSTYKSFCIGYFCKNKNICTAALGGVLILAGGVMAAGGMMPGGATRDAGALSYQTSIDQSFTINDTLTITLSDSQVSIEGLLPGQSADSSILDVTVMSNNPYGYKLTGTVGNSNYTADALYNTADSTKALSSIGFGNNKSSLGDFDPNTWGYSYSTDGGTTWKGSGNNTGYTGLPLYSSANTATFLDTDDVSAETGDTVKFKLGAKASSDKEPGRYNNTINFVATGYSIPSYTVTYNANGGTVSPASESTRSSVTLPTPSYSGYIFQGWCDGVIASSTCSGTTYDAGDTYTPGANVTLTAMWEQDITPMQDFACSSLSAGETTILKDARDNIQYNVGKLADGKCWMLDNLAFNGKDNQGNGDYITMDSTNTHINTTKTWSDTIRTGWTSSSQNSYVASYINDASKDVVPSDATSQAGQYKVGVYYNYCAATLDTICSSSTYTEASFDVCPKGWKLPAGNTSGDFSALAQAIYGSTGSTSDPTAYANYRAALRLPLPGRFDSGSPSYQDSYGYWWSTTAYNGTIRYYLGVDTSTNIYPANNAIGSRRLGFSIRCISSQ